MAVSCRVMVVVVMAFTVEVVGPAAGRCAAGPRCGQAAGWASRAAPSAAGCSGDGSGLA